MLSIKGKIAIAISRLHFWSTPTACKSPAPARDVKADKSGNNKGGGGQKEEYIYKKNEIGNKKLLFSVRLAHEGNEIRYPAPTIKFFSPENTIWRGFPRGDFKVLAYPKEVSILLLLYENITDKGSVKACTLCFWLHKNI